MEAHELAVEQRVRTGKGSARKSRAKGHVPGVVYGKDIEPFSISFEPTALRTVMKSSHGMNSVIRLMVEGKSDPVLVMIKDLQSDPLSRSIVHSDFIQVSESRPVIVEVPLHLDGRPVGVKAGGLLQQLVRTITVRCLPQNIPVELRADVSHLDINESLHVKDLPLPAGTEALYRTNFSIATVLK
jgi:large subunit ribosomal protein L25